MTLAEVIDTLQTWIRNADDEYDREEMGRVAGLKEALHEIKKIEPCEDVISRQAALDSFGLSEKSRKYGGDHSGYDTIMLYEVQDVLETLSSVQPKPKTGHWIFDEILDKHYYCSECKSMGVDYWDYCPNCGAKMVEPQESEAQDADKCTYEETGCGSCKMQLNCQKQSQESEDKE